jgi:phosphate transport system substrate-binding protein
MRGLLLIIMLATSASSLQAAERKKLVITGSSTIAPLILEVAKQFEAGRAGVRIDVQTGGSSRGITDARQGTADIGMVSRPLTAEESDLIAQPIAMDGIGIILHRDNVVKSLTKEQIVAIYTGKIDNWKSVGGQDAPIVVVGKAEGRSTLELFLAYTQLKATDVKAAVIIGDNAQGIKTVAGNPQAIGYVSIGTAEFEAKSGAKIALLPLEGIDPTVANVSAGKFPLSRPLNLVTKGQAKGLTKEFIEFARSAAVEPLVVGQFFVPIAKRLN